MGKFASFIKDVRCASRHEKRDVEKLQIALLFLTYTNLNHPALWKRFLELPQGHQFRPYIHNKGPFECSLGFDKYILSRTVQTKWGHKSLVSATLLLLHESLKDPHNRFFALLSNSCIPIRTPSQIIHDLHSNPRSRISINVSSVRLNSYFDIRDFWKGGPHVYQSQWMVLNREAAIFFVQRNFTVHFSDSTQIILDEHYFANICLKYNLDIENSVSTFVNWKEKENNCHPKTYRVLNRDILTTIKKQNHSSFFMRKLAVDAEFLDGCHEPWSV